MSLSGKKGLIVGIANEHSIAYGCADAFRRAGAAAAITYRNATAEPCARPLPCPARLPALARKSRSGRRLLRRVLRRR
jgi:enoyl-[acyl-carrier protein] reductase I